MSPILIKGLIASGGVSLGGVGIWQITEYMAPKTIRERLERDGEKFYSLDGDQDKEGWKSLAKKYKTDSVTNTDNQISGLNITQDEPNEDDIRNMREKCKGLAEKPLVGGYEPDMARVKRWCLAPKTGGERG